MMMMMMMMIFDDDDDDDDYDYDHTADDDVNNVSARSLEKTNIRRRSNL